ncbi:MAG: PfaD family polyunsaturated fatty acid/polyketide biosynthesis protein [Elainellaceae cyanobacterium]
MIGSLAVPAQTSSPLPDTAHDGLAIIGMDCLFPDANGIEQFWQNILNRHCSIRMIEEQKLPIALRGKIERRLGAPMPKLEVKSQKFKLPPSTTRNFDSRVLPMLEIVKRVFDQNPHIEREKTLAVLCSQKMMPQEEVSTLIERRLKVTAILDELKSLQTLSPEAVDQIRAEFQQVYEQYFPNPGFEGFLAESSSLMTSMVSKAFDIGGGHIAIDATCASTITAIQIAWDAICTGRNDAAVIIALSPEVRPSRFAHYAQLSIFTQDAVLPFDVGATGSAPGEGIGVMMVKRLRDAEAAGDRIHAVIRGVGFSSDGMGSGFVSPKQDGQMRAMQTAYQMAGIDPQSVRLVEAHATGAPKGDITELKSLEAIFGRQSQGSDKVVIGSVKGNIGHLLAASGMAGIFKSCCALSNGILPPTIFRNGRPELQNPQTQFELLEQPKQWPEQDSRRFAAVSSFGFGGVNAHAILEAHPSTAKGLQSSLQMRHPVAMSLVNGADMKQRTPNALSKAHVQPDRESSLSLLEAEESVVNNPTVATANATPPQETDSETTLAVNPTDRLSDAEVEAGVFDIIAECTGYEVDELQLDHDLDADLGVDSLKHMEVLLKLGDRFQIQAQEDDQITDYPTIARLVELAQTRQNTSTGEQASGLMDLVAGLDLDSLPSDAMAQLEQLRPQGLDLESDPAEDEPTVDDQPTPSLASAQTTPEIAMTADSTSSASQPDVMSARVAEMITDATSPVTPEVPPADNPLSDAEVEAGVLDIIAECTGYEVDELQLDHDLDADLGVDSLKHMEVLLKLGDRFRIQAQEDDQITDYPTIARLVELAQTRQNTSTGEQASGLMDLVAGLDLDSLPSDAMAQLEQLRPQADAPASAVSSSEATSDVPSQTPASIGSKTITEHADSTPELNGTSEAIARITQALATHFNYEPEWLPSYLSPTSDLGLSQDDMQNLLHPLGLSVDGTQSWTIQQLAEQLIQAPQTPPVSKPETTAQPAPAQPLQLTEKVEDWVLIFDQASPSDPDLATHIWERVQQSDDILLRLEYPQASHRFAYLLNRSDLTDEGAIATQLTQAAGRSAPKAGIWWNDIGTTTPSMAWLFPGSGSLYPGFWDDLSHLHPIIQDTVEQAKAAFRQHVGQELTFEVTTNPLWQRPVTVAASTAMARLFQSFGLHPNLVAGHSVGELTACHWAGAFDLSDLIRLTTAPFKSLKQYPDGSMVAVIGPEAETLKLVQASQGRVVVSNRNSSQQLVISGHRDDIASFTDQTQQHGLKAIALDVCTAYHSPLLNSAHQQYRQVLQATQFQLPTIPVVSGLTGDLLPWSNLNGDQTRALLDCAFIAPVNHVAQAQRLYDLGARVLVDMGPGNRLARLARNNLNQADVTILSASQAKRSSQFAVLETLAQLYVLGVPIRGGRSSSKKEGASITASYSSSTLSDEAIAPPSPPVAPAALSSLEKSSAQNGSGRGAIAAPPVVPFAPAIAVETQNGHGSLTASDRSGSGNDHTAIAPSGTNASLALDFTAQRPMLLEPIAIVGMGGILPDAQSITEFWQNLISGHNAIRELPQDSSLSRWNLDTFYHPDPRVPDKTYSKIGAFVPDFDFKPIQFRLTPKTSRQMDRSQKLALLSTREAFQSSGYHERSFDRRRVRVIMGTSIPELQEIGSPRLYFDQVAESFQRSEVFCTLPKDVQQQIITQARDAINRDIPPCSEDSMPGGLPNIVAGRIAFCFDIQGGNVVLDAACAASLAAVDHAINSLRLGEVDMVIAGGADTAMSPASYVGFCKTYALSSKGSYPFDARADGFVMGEGAGILILKRLSDAEHAGDTIHAVIRGVGSSSDGRSRGITAPKLEGQVLAVRNAYAEAGIDPSTVGLIEAHGTATDLGDATEFASLADVFGATPRNTPLYLGSVKSMIGHLKAAAGIAGLLKAALSVREAQIPPTLNFESPNSKINLDDSPFTINTTTCPWVHTATTPRRAAVNSFGFGGTNFHVIVEAYDPEFYRSEIFQNELLASRGYRDFYGRFQSLPVSIGSQNGKAAASLDGTLTPSTPIQQAIAANQPQVLPNRELPPEVLPPEVLPPEVLIDQTSWIQGDPLDLTVLKQGGRSPLVIPTAAENTLGTSIPQSVMARIQAIAPQDLGSASFRRDHGIRYSYIAGAMASGIGSTDMVIAMAKAGMLGFFGAGGLDLNRVEAALHEISHQLSKTPQAAYGFNLLHNPIEAGVEDRTVDLYLRYGVRKVSASAYLRLTPSVVRYRATGMRRLPDGRIDAPNSVFAKVSSLAVAAQFMAPPPASMLKQLVTQGKITASEAELAAQLPVAQDITAEADSGGHTDRRPLSVLLPQMLRLRDQIAAQHDYQALGIELRVGTGGGIGDPLSMRAAFALGADYVLTGSINQTSCQAGTSMLAKQMLAQATMADVVMAPAADMFEMGVQVQVLKRGSLYAQRSRKLYEIYKQYESIESVPPEERAKLERDIFHQPLEEVWSSTEAYWKQRDPQQLQKAERQPKHKMALLFRAYLGLSSRWAQTGQGDRKSDYQIWCGPSMGLFNSWVVGTWLEPIENRDVVLMALALLQGTAVLTRAEQLSHYGVSLPNLSELSKPADREFLLQLHGGRYSA